MRLRDGAHQLPVVCADLPDHDAAEGVVAHVLHLGADGFRIVVADPCPGLRVVEPRDLRRRFPVADVAWIAQPRARETSPVAARIMPVGWLTRRVLKETAIHVGDAAIDARKKWNSDEQLVGGDAAGTEGLHAGVDG